MVYDVLLYTKAFFKVWYDIGLKMNIKNLPDTYEKLMKFRKVKRKRIFVKQLCLLSFGNILLTSFYIIIIII